MRDNEDCDVSPFKPRRLMAANPSIPWDQYFLNIAYAVSLRGDCIRRKVGAVLVDNNHIIRGVGYNGSVPGGRSCLAGECPRCLDPSIPSGTGYENCIERHAEDNCILNSYSYPPGFMTMYITCPPCDRCKEILFQNRISKAVWPGGSLDFIPRL